MVRKILRPVYMFADNLRYALGNGKPLLVARLVRNHLMARAGWQIPRSLCVAVDYKCNLKCEHCSAICLTDESQPAMTMDQYRTLAAQAEGLRFFNIQFTGGEPLLRKDLEEIVSAFNPRSNFLMVSTNAILLDDRRVRSLKEAGVDALSVSLDSRDPDVHDSFRGRKGSWRETVEAVKRARKGGLKVGLSAVVTHQNIRSRDLEELAEFIKSLGCGMQLNWACPVGAWAGNREARLTDDDMDHLFKFLERYPHARTDFDGNYKHRGCPAAKEMMYITVQGEYLPCAFIPITYGNVTREPLKVIRDRALGDPAYSEYWNRCPSACDDEFYEQYLRATFGRSTPLPYGQREKANKFLNVKELQAVISAGAGDSATNRYTEESCTACG